MSERKQRVKRERFLPFRHERLGLEMAVRGVVLDGDRDVETVDTDRRLIDVTEVGWSRIVLHGTLRAPRATLDHVFPPGERRSPPVRYVIAVRGPKTRLRRGEAVPLPKTPTGAASFELGLDRSDVCGTVDLVPYLLRSQAAPLRTVGFASEVNDRLASARPWSVRVDRARSPAGEFLDTRYHPFSSDPQLRPYSRALYRLELSEQPTLWINTDHARVAAVLEGEGTRGAHARIREVVFDHIGLGVWNQLFVQAALDLRRGELVFPWEETVLRELLPGVVEGRTHHARLAALAAALERDELPDLLSRLDACLQRRDRLVEHIEKLIEDAGGRG